MIGSTNRLRSVYGEYNTIPPKPLLPRWINNILVIISTVVSTLLTLLVLVLLTKYFKIKSLLATLVLSTLPPPPQATALKHDLRQLDLPGHSVLKPFQTYSPKYSRRINL